MIFSIASLAAVLVDQVTQAPVVVQCPQAAPLSEWRWWFGALAPWIGPLSSGVVSIYVAWRVFCWQGEKDRQQWILDQRRAEWRDILRVCDEIAREFLPAYRQGDTSELLIGRVRSAHEQVRSLPTKYVFISGALSRPNLRFGKFVQEIGKSADEMANSQFSAVPERYANVRREFQRLVLCLGGNAQLDLGVLKRNKHGFVTDPEWDDPFTPSS